jgi:hypothetical protein
MKLKGITHQFVTVLAVTAGLTLALATQAQYITGDKYLDHCSTVAGWGSYAIINSGINFTPTGIEMQAPVSGGYGGANFVIDTGNIQTFNPADTAVQLTITLNGDPTPYIWFSPGQIVLTDDSGSYDYSEPYFGWQNAGNPLSVVWSNTTATITLPLQLGQLARIQAGNDHIYSFDLDVDPFVISTPTYDVTFNSIQLIPEPATVTLVGLGLLGLLGLRRRHTS